MGKQNSTISLYANASYVRFTTTDLVFFKKTTICRSLFKDCDNTLTKRLYLKCTGIELNIQANFLKVECTTKLLRRILFIAFLLYVKATR